MTSQSVDMERLKVVHNRVPLRHINVKIKLDTPVKYKYPLLVGSYEHKNEGMCSVIIIIIIIIIENFQPAEWLLASQGVCSTKVVISTNTKIQLHSTTTSLRYMREW
jgi:hypothetical protein